MGGVLSITSEDDFNVKLGALFKRDNIDRCRESCYTEYFFL